MISCATKCATWGSWKTSEYGVRGLLFAWPTTAFSSVTRCSPSSRGPSFVGLRGMACAWYEATKWEGGREVRSKPFIFSSLCHGHHWLAGCICVSVRCLILNYNNNLHSFTFAMLFPYCSPTSQIFSLPHTYPLSVILYLHISSTTDPWRLGHQENRVCMGPQQSVYSKPPRSLWPRGPSSSGYHPPCRENPGVQSIGRDRWSRLLYCNVQC